MELVSQDKEVSVHIQIIDRSGPSVPLDGGFFMHGMPTEAPAPTTELPEFHFSPRRDLRETFLTTVSKNFQLEALKLQHRQPVHHGPMVVGTLQRKVKTHKHHTRRVSAAESAWLQYKQAIQGKVAADHSKTPHGTVPFWSIQNELDRRAELQWLEETQALDTPTTTQELRAAGIDAFRLELAASHKDDAADDDTTEYVDYQKFAARREWEEFILHCKPTQRIWLEPKGDGKLTVQTDSVKLTPDDLKQLGRKLKQMLGERSAADLQNDRDRVAFFGKIGSCLYGAWHGDHPGIEQDMDALGAEDYADREEKNGGPQELGLHNVFEGIVEFEPTPQELWPDDYPMSWVQELVDAISTDPDPSWLPEHEGLRMDAVRDLFSSYEAENAV